VETDLTLPEAGHFIHRDATEIVNNAMVHCLRTD
jgi:hypothetical protein